MFEELYSHDLVRPENMLCWLMHLEADMVNFDFCRVSSEAGMVNLRNGIVS